MKTINQKSIKINTKKRAYRKVSLLKLSLLSLFIFMIIFCLYSFSNFIYGKAYNYVAEIKSANLIAKESASSNLNAIENSGNTQASRKIEDKDVISYISKHITLPNEDIMAMIKVKNPLDLEEVSPIYKGVQKDDYILVYSSLAIIYDAKNDKILKTINLKVN